MRSNVVKSLDRLHRLSWQSMWMNFLICPLVGIVVLICSQSHVAAVLTYTLLSVMWITLAEYRLLKLTEAALDGS